MLGKKVVTDLVFPFARDKVPGLVSSKASNATSNTINKFERIIRTKGVVRAGKKFTLLISNEYMNGIIKNFSFIWDLIYSI